MGAWIETYDSWKYCRCRVSHPTWVRGLKPVATVKELKTIQSHPTWVRGLKQAMGVMQDAHVRRTLRGCVD